MYLPLQFSKYGLMMILTGQGEKTLHLKILSLARAGSTESLRMGEKGMVVLDRLSGGRSRSEISKGRVLRVLERPVSSP